ncbi:hypothetical protein JHK86_003340 [Glycine max]|nr:hypothetical protein JHK86_003340 [Glycine max]
MSARAVREKWWRERWSSAARQALETTRMEREERSEKSTVKDVTEAGREAQYFNANPYDYLQLALRWPNSYCLTHEGGCREIVPQYFTISYLHPMRRGGPDLQNCPSPFNMPNSTMEINKNDLLKYWPDLRTDNFIESKSLWRDQWRKFGSCYSMMPDDYIVYALNSRKRNDLKKILTNAGIVASGNPYPTRRILQAFRKALGVNVDIVCEPDRSGNVYLAEVHQCVDAAGTTSIDCDNKARGCDDDPIFPYMGFQPDKDPNKGRRVSCRFAYKASIFGHQPQPKATEIPKGKKYKMIMNSILLVLLLMEILNCEAQYFDASPYDYLELALRWPNSYCLTHEDGCREIVPQYFTISYFRPRKLGGPDLQYCPTPITLSNNIIETNKYDLLRFWPDLRTDNFIESKSLWRDQWKKFGSCCFMMPDDYFVYALNNRKRYDLKRILTSAGQTARPNTLKNLRKRDVARRRPLSSWNMEMQEILWVKAHEPPLLWVVQFDDEVEDMSTLMEEDRRCSLISASFQHVGQFFTLRARAIQGGGNAAALSGKDRMMRSLKGSWSSHEQGMHAEALVFSGALVRWQRTRDDGGRIVVAATKTQ